MKAAVRRQVVSGVTLAAGLALGGLTSARSQGTPPPRGSAEPVIVHVHGTVVGSVDGRAVGRALVTSNDGRMATMTDTEGRFSFDVRVTGGVAGTDFASMPYGSGGQIRGYATYISVRRQGFLQQQVIVRVPAVTELTVKLVPEAILAGRVSVSGGELPHGMQVMLRRRQVQEGIGVWQQVASSPVNPRGEFRFAELAAGEYKLSTQGRPDNPAGAGNAQAETRGLLPAYNGDAGDLASAAPLRVKPGETTQENLHVRSAAFYRVSIPVAGVAPNVGVSWTVGSPDGSPMYPLGRNPKTQAAEGYLPNGAWDILFSSGQPQTTGRTRVTVSGGPVTAAPVALVPAGQIPIIVHEQYTATSTQQSPLGMRDGPLAPAVNLFLRPVDGMGQGAGMRPHKPGEDLVLENVREGRYWVQAMPARYPGYVYAVRSGGVDLLREPLTVGAGGTSEPIDITLRDDSGTVKATIDAADGPGTLADPDEMAWVACLPADGVGRQPQITLARGGGAATFASLAPGTYLMLASKVPVQNLEYRNEEAMRRYRTLGKEVTVTAGGTAQVQVGLMPEGVE